MSLLDHVCASMWAIEPKTLDRMLTIVERHDAGVKLSAEQIQSAIGRPPRMPNPRDRSYQVTQGVALVPISGVIHKHASQAKDISGPSGTSYEQILENIDTAVADPEVRSILLHIESPGGAADGMTAAAADIAAANAKKPIWALIDGVGASAAYGLAVNATRVLATESSLVGSIGTMAVMRDTSAAAEKAGVRTMVIRSAPLKGGAVSGEKVTDEHLADQQRLVDGLSKQFYDLVSAGRDLSGDALAAVTDGRLHLAAPSKDLGLIDGVSTLQSAIAAMTDLTQVRKSTPRALAAPATAESNTVARAVSTTQGINPMKIDPQDLKALVASNKAHAELIVGMAAGSTDKAPASKAEIEAALKDADLVDTKASLTTAQAKVVALEKDLVTAATAHKAAIDAKDAELVQAKARLADAEKIVGKKGVEPLEGDAPKTVATDAITAYTDKVAELKKAGDKSPDRTMAEKHPEIRSAWLAAIQPQKKEARS